MWPISSAGRLYGVSIGIKVIHSPSWPCVNICIILLLLQILISKARELLRLLILPPEGFYSSQGRRLSAFE
jgi:hypothetical protein